MLIFDNYRYYSLQNIKICLRKRYHVVIFNSLLIVINTHWNWHSVSICVQYALFNRANTFWTNVILIKMWLLKSFKVYCRTFSCSDICPLWIFSYNVSFTFFHSWRLYEFNLSLHLDNSLCCCWLKTPADEQFLSRETRNFCRKRLKSLMCAHQQRGIFSQETKIINPTSLIFYNIWTGNLYLFCQKSPEYAIWRFFANKKPTFII